MPRNGSGVFSLPAGSTITNGDTSDASDVNAPLSDIETDMNTARPIVAGGTGATTAAGAQTALGGTTVGKSVFTAVDAAAARATLVQTHSVLSKSTSYTVLPADRSNTIICTDTLTLTLPAAATAADGFFFTVHASGGDVTLDGDGSETVNGATTAIIYDGESALVACNGTAWTAIISGPPRSLLVRATAAAGSSNGTFTAGSFQTRNLTEATINRIPGASLDTGTSRVTLPAGKYRVRGSAPAYRVSNHAARVYNITGSAVLVVGSPEYSDSAAAYAQTRSNFDGTFTLASASVIEIQHQCAATSATNGLGLATGYQSEVYTIAEFTKLA